MPYDKTLHFAAGAAISLAAGVLIGPIWGLAAAIAAGIYKEIYDYVDYGRPDVWDAVATAAGGLLAYLVIVLVR